MAIIIPMPERTIIKRCAYTWKCDDWPHIRRCEEDYTEEIMVDGELQRLCAVHAEDAKEYIARGEDN